MHCQESDKTEQLSLHSNNQREWWLVLGSVSGYDGKWSYIVYTLKNERKIFADATNVGCESKKKKIIYGENKSLSLII